MSRATFLREGYGNASMEAIALATGVSKSTLYSRYPDKAALFRAVVGERILAWVADTFAHAQIRGNDPAECLYDFGVAFMNGMQHPEVMAFERLVAAEAHRFPELAGEFQRQGLVTWSKRLAERIEAVSARSTWPIQDAMFIAELFTSALSGWHRNRTMVGHVNQDECVAFVNRTIGVLVAGRAAW